MLRILKYLFILFSVVLTSCATHALYVPTLVNTPNFDSTNKYQINIAGGIKHYELQAAVSPLKSFGIMHNIHYSDKGNNVDIAFGYYKNNFLFKNFSFDVFAGYGVGERKYWDKTKHLEDEHYMGFTVDNSFKKYYSQVSLYQHFKKGHQLSFTFRASHIDYNWFNYSIDYSSPDNTSSAFNRKDVYINDNLTVACFDYMLTYKYRYRMVGFFIQPGVYINNGPKNELKDLHFSYPRQFVLNTGFNLYFGKRYKN